jgi:hypothetical protein
MDFRVDLIVASPNECMPEHNKRRIPMKCASICLSIIISLFLLVSCTPTTEPEAPTEEVAGPTVEGVWEIEEIETIGGPDEGKIVPQAGILIFTKQYYSSVRDTAVEPRPLWGTTSPSDAQIVESFNTFGADSGKYELNESTITFRPVVCDMPDLMSGGSVTFDYQLTDDTFTLILKPGQLIIPGVEVNVEYTEQQYKMRRLE